MRLPPTEVPVSAAPSRPLQVALALHLGVGPVTGILSGSALVAMSLSVPQGPAGDTLYWITLFLGMASGFVPSSLAAISVGVREGYWGMAIYLPVMVAAAWLPWHLLRKGPADHLRGLLEKHAQVGPFLSFVDRSPFPLLLGIRLAPFAVFAWTNALFALSPIRWLPYLVGTAAGAIPRALAMVAAGNGARNLSDAVARGEDPVLRAVVLGAGIVGILVLGALGGQYFLARSRETARTRSEA